MLCQATGESFEDLGQAVLMSKECKEGEGLPGRFLVDVHWSGDMPQSSVNQAFTRNQSLT